MVIAQASEFTVGEARRAAASQRAGVFGHPGDAVAVSPAPARTTVRARALVVFLGVASRVVGG